jgi:diaminohydroxyphosphoribosylaminopyrimidine deaminase/5-amino-6-(5-phosphoribosylamino)uracil reductase
MIKKSSRFYLHHKETGKPYVTVKAGISLDGKMISNEKWITCAESRYDSHHLRLKCQAILVGTQTALLDKPKLNVRLNTDDPLYSISKKIMPLRCFIDRYGKVTEGDLLNTEFGPVCIFTSHECSAKSLKIWKERNINIVYINNLHDILNYLGEYGIHRLLVEGGPKLITSFINENIVNEFIIYQAQLLLPNNTTIYSGLSIQYLKIRKIKTIGSDIRIKLNFK